MTESPQINAVLQRFTVKVEGILHGTGVICKLSDTTESLLIITAKHNVCGSKFRDTPTFKNVRLSFLWDVQSSLPQYRTYALRPTDQILCSESNEEDLCVIIVNRLTIESLIGELPTIRLTNNPDIFGSVIFRGFPDAYCGEEAIRMNGHIMELRKPLPYSIEIEVKTELVAKWLPADVEEDRTALDNSVGFSGSGLFIRTSDDSIYLLGIVRKLGRFNRFFCTNIEQINPILEKANLPPVTLDTVFPFTSKQVLSMERFIAEYENTKWATPLSNKFIGRIEELKTTTQSLSNNTITIVTGSGGPSRHC